MILCGSQYIWHHLDSDNQRKKKKSFSLPLPIRSDKHQLLGFGFGWQNVDFPDYRINGDNLHNVKENYIPQHH